MKWNDTTASSCRYGSNAEVIFGNADIIWESSEAGYQGHANILAHMPDGTFVHYEWTYGSCSGCDSWERAEMNDEQIEAEMRRTMSVLQDETTCAKYLHLDPEVTSGMKYPVATPPDNGGLSGMIRALSGSMSSDFQAMGEAFSEWRKNR